MKRYRHQLRLCQRQFGRLFGLGQTQVSEIETGKRAVPDRIAVAMVVDSPEKFPLDEIKPELNELLIRVACHRLQNNMPASDRG